MDKALKNGMEKGFIDAVKAGDVGEAKTWFQTMMFKKMKDALDNKQKEVSKNVFSNVVKKAALNDD